MTLKELGYEYLKQSEVIEKRLENEKENLCNLYGLAHREAEKRIKMLCEMKKECNATAARLIHYYDSSREE